MEKRNLVVCCDGTWNTENETDGSGLPVPTNVAKLFHASIKDDKQLVYYHSGVGTEGAWFARVKGGAIGMGLGENIRSAYGWLAKNYIEGDQIYIFGFSRGAYTARALAGMIGVCGLLNQHGQIQTSPQWAEIKTLFNYYRKRDRADWESVKGWTYYNRVGQHSPKGTTPVHFVGVWDTVGSFGVPPELGLLRLVQWLFPVELHDNQLGAAVIHARHAVALDENRATFMPTLWDERPGKRGAQVQSLKQRWFPGCHSDVGGGYGDSGLSDASLEWMIGEAVPLDLRVDTNLVGPAPDGVALQILPNPLSVMHQSVEGIFKHMRTQHRPVPYLDAANTCGNLSASTMTRLERPTLRQGRYRPNWPLGPETPVEIFASQQWNETGIYLKEGVTYRFIAKGEWIDGTIKCTPAGAIPWQFRLGRVIWLASDIVGLFDRVLLYASKALDKLGAHIFHKKRAPLKQRELASTRRYSGANWFVLVGVIANGTTGDDSIFEPNQTLAIGAGGTFKPVRSGYLFCFANDAWIAYTNNRGSVWLTVVEEVAAKEPAAKPAKPG